MVYRSAGILISYVYHLYSSLAYLFLLFWVVVDNYNDLVDFQLFLSKVSQDQYTVHRAEGRDPKGLTENFRGQNFIVKCVLKTVWTCCISCKTKERDVRWIAGMS